MYKFRREKNGKNITSQIDFYEDRFESVTKIKTRAFDYGRAIKLLLLFHLLSHISQNEVTVPSAFANGMRVNSNYVSILSEGFV